MQEECERRKFSSGAHAESEGGNLDDAVDFCESVGEDRRTRSAEYIAAVKAAVTFNRQVLSEGEVLKKVQLEHEEEENRAREDEDSDSENDLGSDAARSKL
eukprot:CAMPEP_0185854766 /NCGR_PEP_ID=MMETSP1354-20130828/23453_1 /TAXON_ID=708628 /ORGANISM="Erythrolobus madagascarensis, Strain CCMP3276" /LENGTH=100 /DNA_ID=CAMNT_0028556611 /DNA_START=99 /DNA_END=399 /DNA_ORIENTATION=+